MKYLVRVAMLGLLLTACATNQIPPPDWNAVNQSTESEYLTYLKGGSGKIAAQAFLTQKGGGVVKAAGRNVTLDPATSVGNEWWGKAGKSWAFKSLTPPSPNFHKARKTVVADADGRFKFHDLAEGQYYLRTEVTWLAGTATQGGLVGARVEVKNGKITEAILNQYAK